MTLGQRCLAVAATSAFFMAACSGSGPASNGTSDASAPTGAGDATSPVSEAGDVGGDSSPSITDGSPSALDAVTGCGEFAGDAFFTCSKDGNSRGKCPGDASLVVEQCPNGCLREPAGQDSICMGTTDTFSCPGAYGTVPAQDGNYYMSSFGCWVDVDGGTHSDPGDNCIPSCLAKAQAAGVCHAGETGPQCENRVNWFTADAARFGCLQHLRVTNPKNGKALIAVALDFGPGCSGETAVQKEVLDSSGAIDAYLFGGPQGSSDKSVVHVVEVDDATPLGPI